MKELVGDLITGGIGFIGVALLLWGADAAMKAMGLGPLFGRKK
jgi:hypothetical protein